MQFVEWHKPERSAPTHLQVIRELSARRGQQEQEQVDKIEIQRQRSADDQTAARGMRADLRTNLFQTIRIIRGQADKQCDADEIQRPIETRRRKAPTDHLRQHPADEQPFVNAAVAHVVIGRGCSLVRIIHKKVPFKKSLQFAANLVVAQTLHVPPDTRRILQ